MALNADANFISASSKDEALPVFKIGERVKLTQEIKNDGTYYGLERGEVVIAPPATGFIRHIGDFLQTIRIYDVDFFKEGKVVGCREFEIESVDDEFSDVEDELNWLKEHRKSGKGGSA